MTEIYIETIPMLPFGMLNAFLLVHDQKAILVDTGLPNSEGKIGRALQKHGLDWSSISLIVLTHAHIDHAGSAVAVQALSSAPIMAHQLETPYCQGEPPITKATRLFGRLFYKTGAIEKPFSYFTPDRPMTTPEVDLGAYGFPARVLFTPGHTPGSVSVLLGGDRVIAGDLAASGILLGGVALKNRPIQPPFEEDSGAVATSLNELLSRGCRMFYLGHGGPVSAKTIEAHRINLRKIDRV